MNMSLRDFIRKLRKKKMEHIWYKTTTSDWTEFWYDGSTGTWHENNEESML